MGRADGVEARILQQLHPAVFALVPGGSAQNTIVVVETTAPQEGLLAIDQQPLVGPLHRSDPKRDLCLIHAVCHLGGVAMVGLVAPQLSVGNF